MMNGMNKGEPVNVGRSHFQKAFAQVPCKKFANNFIPHGFKDN